MPKKKSDTIRVCITVTEAGPWADQMRVADDLTLVPGEAYDVDPTRYAIASELACGRLTELKDDEEPHPLPEPTEGTIGTAHDFLQ